MVILLVFVNFVMRGLKCSCALEGSVNCTTLINYYLKSQLNYTVPYILGGEESDSSSSSSGSESDIEKDEKISSVLFMQVGRNWEISLIDK